MSALQRLAAAYGITSAYDDIWGKRHPTSDLTRRKLLRAIGIALPDDGDLQARAEGELQRLEQQAAREALPPLTVVREGHAERALKVCVAKQAVADLQLTIESEQRDLDSVESISLREPFGGHVSQRGTRQFDGDGRVDLSWPLPAELPAGYYRIALHCGSERIAEGALALAPARCWQPDDDDGRRHWGLALQLYGVRSERNWGIGDFTDLADVMRLTASRGAAFVGVSPLHALFPHNPQHVSPYSPSSRLASTVLALDVEAVFEIGECEAIRKQIESADFQAQLTRLRASELVDYPAVAALKLPLLRDLHRHFRQRHLEPPTERGRSFLAYLADSGVALQRHALFEALQQHFHEADDQVWGWPVWPAAYRDPESAEVARFAKERREEVEFYAWLQWQAELQRVAAAHTAYALGMRIGVYADLAVSIDPAGAEAWANQSIYALGASVGAPPDAFNAKGQNWGLPPMIPHRLRDAGYAPFIATLRANMRNAGALRIDHVMGLQRLFWVPQGAGADEGAYVEYPVDDLLGLLALESHRHQCRVVGEDLGTVPDSIRAALSETGVLSYRVLLFERDSKQQFKAPSEYLPAALVTGSTHDLPTLPGWWRGDDIGLRYEFGLMRSVDDRDREFQERNADRYRLLQALKESGLLPDDIGLERPPRELSASLVRAIHRYLAATPCTMMAVQPEDLLGVHQQANLPGTTDQHPNWRRKLPRPIEQWLDDPTVRSILDDLHQARGSRDDQARIPRATYRLQLHRDFTLADATALIPYLAALGVSHVYCSPYLRARPGSMHGYDIVDHTALNPELGTRADFDRFVAALRQHRMGHIADVVPNHMGVMGSDNAWWMDVLENGPASEYAQYFDIDWSPLDPELAGRVLVPVLGASYGQVLAAGEIELQFEAENGSLVARYFEHRFPLDPHSWPPLLAIAVDQLRGAQRGQLADIVSALRLLPTRDDAAATVATRQRDCARIKRELAALAGGTDVRAAIERATQTYAGSGADALHRLLEAQAFRLAHWRVAFDEINYRRFFDINELAALRMENPRTFEDTHRFVLDLAAAGYIDGLRIDHPDGLHDPAAYFCNVQRGFARRAGLSSDAARPIYLVVEKIIAPHERLPETWPVHGTTGYRFANAVNGVLVDSEAERRIDRVWRGFVGDEAEDFETQAYVAKRAMIRGPLAAGVTVLANLALRIARSDLHTRDHTLAGLRRAIEEVAAWFPVYRTYVTEQGASAQDRRYIEWAIGRARSRNRAGGDLSVYDFLRRLMLGEAHGGNGDVADAPLVQQFMMKFQQFTAPVAAKGIEDTAFYRFNRLLSLADVGGEPSTFGMTVRAFHGASLDRATHWPSTMLATSTHDNKRSEDVRARINVLSEMPAAWRLTLRRWARFNRSRKRVVDETAAPSRNDEYLLYQTLIGTFDASAAGLSAYRERIAAYLLKAIRESKVHTSWIAPNEDYEQATAAFVHAVLADGDNLFVDDLRQQAQMFAWYGQLASLSMALLKFCSPGVPDLYQGNELLDDSLVDPDNRRPVNWSARQTALRALSNLPSDGSTLKAHFEDMLRLTDGRAKLWLIHRLLEFRRRHARLFEQGDYLPLTVQGGQAKHAVAFARRCGDEGLLVIASRLHASLGGGVGEMPVGDAVWHDTELQTDLVADALQLEDVLTGRLLQIDGSLAVARAFEVLPLAAYHYRAAPTG